MTFAIAVQWRLLGEKPQSRTLSFGFDRIGTPGGASRTVLLAEPDADTRRIYGMALEHAGYRVIPAANGQECVDLARRWTPDLVLAEMFNPRLDGHGIRNALRADLRTAWIPVVAVTTCDLPEIRHGAAALGFAGYWLKPIEPRALVRGVQQTLGRRKQAA